MNKKCYTFPRRSYNFYGNVLIRQRVLPLNTFDHGFSVPRDVLPVCTRHTAYIYTRKTKLTQVYTYTQTTLTWHFAVRPGEVVGTDAVLPVAIPDARALVHTWRRAHRWKSIIT